MPKVKGRQVQQKPVRSHAGTYALVVVGVIAVAVAIYISSARQTGAATPGALVVTIDMSGFKPPKLTVPAGKSVGIALKNPDSSLHTDGGGIHDFVIENLGIKQTVQPKSVLNFTLPPLQAGTYGFYCDACCGGKDNPSMRGTLVVT